MQTIQNGVKPVCGTLLWMGERRKIAVYLRNSVPWVADFTDGRGELYAPGEWFSLNGGDRRARSGKSHRPNSTEGGAYRNYRRQVPILLPWTRANSGDC